MSLACRLDAAVGDTAVEFAVAVENAGEEPVELSFRSGQTVDVTVYADGDAPDDGTTATPDEGEPAASDDEHRVWRWSDDRLFTQALRSETLAPGESLAEELTWDDPSSGEYTAVASLAATNVSLAERVSFAVP